MTSVARILLAAGAILIVAGGLLLLADRLGLRHLPGAVEWRKGNVSVFFPIGLMIVASVVLSVVLTLLSRR